MSNPTALPMLHEATLPRRSQSRALREYAEGTLNDYDDMRTPQAEHSS